MAGLTAWGAVSTRRPFSDAANVCGMVDGHLASFKSGEEFAAVVDKLVMQTEAKPSGAGAFWVGATAKVGEAARWA
jgi:hypothetical protein